MGQDGTIQHETKQDKAARSNTNGEQATERREQVHRALALGVRRHRTSDVSQPIHVVRIHAIKNPGPQNSGTPLCLEDVHPVR